MTFEEMNILTAEIDELFERLRVERSIRCGRHADSADVEYVKKVMGGREIFELELVLLRALGPAHLLFPYLSFDRVLEKDSPWFFERVLNLFPEWLKLNWVPISGDGCGNYFVYPLTDTYEEPRPILELATADSTVRPHRIVASHLLIFMRRLLEGELQHENTPFDDECVLRSDTELARIRELYSVDDAPYFLN